jgi:hypothetical protein
MTGAGWRRRLTYVTVICMGFTVTVGVVATSAQDIDPAGVTDTVADTVQQTVDEATQTVTGATQPVTGAVQTVTDTVQNAAGGRPSATTNSGTPRPAAQGGGSAGAASPVTSSGATTRAAGATGPTSFAAGSAAAPARGAGPAATRQTPERRRAEIRRERRLREIVNETSGCLGHLGELQRRVLSMRAGVGPAEPRSRRSVARALDRSVSRVRRAERRGLERLRALRAAPCAQSAAAASGSAYAYGTPAAMAAVAGGPTGGAAPVTPVAAPRPRSDVAGESASGEPEHDGGNGGQSIPPLPGDPAVPGVQEATSPSGIVLLIGLLVAAGVVALIVTGVRRDWPGFG